MIKAERSAVKALGEDAEILIFVAFGSMDQVGLSVEFTLNKMVT
jgi:hypothetical protein